MFRFFSGIGYIEFHQKSQGKTLALSTMKFVVHRFISWQSLPRPGGVAPQQYLSRFIGSPHTLSPVGKINYLSTLFRIIPKLSTYARICYH
jgi:hypothetical protein